MTLSERTRADMNAAETGPAIPSPTRRRWFAAALGLIGLAALAAAGVIPWLYPSSTLLYQFGIDKTLLLAGKSMGMAAGVLLLVQLILVARWRRLERMISQNRLIAAHRWVGILLAATAAAHPLLVFAPTDVTSIPPSIAYWPEMLGAALLVGLLLTAVVALNRDFLGVRHHVWKTGHRLAAPVLSAAFVTHVLFVNDGYASGLPRLFIAALAGAFGLAWLSIAVRPLRRRHPHRVSTVRPAGKDAVTLEMQPVDGRPLKHWPGQFAYLRFRRAVLSFEEHPFTVASPPGRPEGLSFTIRCAGDWTRRVGRVRPGDMVYVDGPYGLFTPEAFAGMPHVVFIAGGIGITPMLSVLRHLAQKDDPRQMTLIWSNRTRDDVVHAEEMQALARRLSGLAVHYVFTRATDGRRAGRLDRDRLNHLLGPYRPGTLILLCGPSDFMKQIRANVKSLGYPGRCIKTEVFRM